MFSQTPSNHYKCGCHLCGLLARGDTRRSNLPNNHYLDKVLDVHGRKFSYPDFNKNFTTTKDKIVVMCNLHGTFTQEYQNHAQGQGCPYCKVSGENLNIQVYLCKLVLKNGEVVLKLGITAGNIKSRLKYLRGCASKELIRHFSTGTKTAVMFEETFAKNFKNVKVEEGYIGGCKTECYSVVDLAAIPGVI